MFFSTILYTALYAGIALAQTPNASFNASTISTVLQEVGSTNASSWCNAQFNSCGILCSGNAAQNTCDSKSLNYTCTCGANNSAPALQYYNPTMLSLICNRVLGDCLAQTAGSQSQQANCKSTIVCGNSSVQAVASAASSSSAAGPTSTGSATGSATGGSGNSPSATQSGSAGASSSKAAAAPVLPLGSNQMATGAFGAGLLAVLGLAL